MLRIQHRPGAFQTRRLRCLQRVSEECPGPRQPSNPPPHREAEADFAFVCERTDPISFRDDLIPAAPQQATEYLPNSFLANGVWFSFHVRDFSAWPCWREAWQPGAQFVE